MGETETNAAEPNSGTAIEIRLNGRPMRVPEQSTLAALLLSLGKDPRTVAVEKNGDIVRRAAFEETVIERDDELELVQFVQGGSVATLLYRPPVKFGGQHDHVAGRSAKTSAAETKNVLPGAD